jgi:hypothetical protein
MTPVLNGRSQRRKRPSMLQKKRHEAALANIEKERDKLERRAKVEQERWEKERGKLEEALKHAAN